MELTNRQQHHKTNTTTINSDYDFNALIAPSWLNSYALEPVFIFYSAIKHGYRCYIS